LEIRTTSINITESRKALRSHGTFRRLRPSSFTALKNQRDDVEFSAIVDIKSLVDPLKPEFPTIKLHFPRCGVTPSNASGELDEHSPRRSRQSFSHECSIFRVSRRGRTFVRHYPLLSTYICVCAYAYTAAIIGACGTRVLHLRHVRVSRPLRSRASYQLPPTTDDRSWARRLRPFASTATLRPCRAPPRPPS